MAETSMRHAASAQLSELLRSLASLTQRLAGSKGAAPTSELPADRLRSDLVTLAGKLNQTVTRLSLAVKPPIAGKAGWEAVQGTTHQLSELCAKCAFAAGKLGAGLLAKELRWAMTDVLEAVQNLVGAFAVSLDKSATPGKVERERHLALTGVVWSAVERLGQTSATEAEAISKGLANELAMMDDGLIEARELLDATGSIASDRDSDDEDDEKLTELERQRVQHALRLLLSAKRLVRRIIAQLIRSPPAPGLTGDVTRVHSLVASLVASQDDLVSTLPGPQDVEELRTFASAFLRDAQTLSDLALRLWPPDPVQPEVDALIAELSLDDTASDRSVPLVAVDAQLAEAGKTLSEL